jgi:hypothetical protein
MHVHCTSYNDKQESGTFFENIYRTRAIITSGLYTFYPLFKVYLYTVTFGLMYGQYSRAVSNQERVIVVRVQY